MGPEDAAKKGISRVPARRNPMTEPSGTAPPSVPSTPTTPSPGASAAAPSDAEPAAPRWAFLGRVKEFVSLFGTKVQEIARVRRGAFTAPFVVMQDGRRRKPRVLFVDAGNATRSQMAEAFATKYGFHAESAGTFPAQAIPEEVRTVMTEKGLGLGDRAPQLLDLRRLEAFDRVIVFGQVLPEMYRRHPNVDEWLLLDPQGFPLEGYRMVRDQTERLVRRLARNWMHKVPAAPAEAPASPPTPPMVV